MNSEPKKSPEPKLENRLQEEYIQTFAQVEEGQMLPGIVVEVGAEYVYVDVGLKSEGEIPIAEFPESPKRGDTVYVILLAKESRGGEVIVSKKKADEKLFWKNLRIAFDQHQQVAGTIARKIKGDFEVDLEDDVNAFLPQSKGALVVKQQGRLLALGGADFVPFPNISLFEIRLSQKGTSQAQPSVRGVRTQ